DPGRIFAAKPLAKLQIRIRYARLCVSPRNLAAYRSTDGKAGLGYGMAFERAANDPTAAPTMMPRFAFRNERNDSDAISTAAISCVTHGSGEIGITKAKRYQCVYQNPISKEADMSIPRSLIAFAAVFAASTSAGYAGPCSQDIARLQAAMDA